MFRAKNLVLRATNFAVIYINVLGTMVRMPPVAVGLKRCGTLIDLSKCGE